MAASKRKGKYWVTIWESPETFGPVDWKQVTQCLVGILCENATASEDHCEHCGNDQVVHNMDPEVLYSNRVVSVFEGDIKHQVILTNPELSQLIKLAKKEM